MNLKWPKWKDRTFVAITVIVSSTILVALGHNGGIVTFLGMVVGYYFGREKSNGS